MIQHTPDQLCVLKVSFRLPFRSIPKYKIATVVILLL